MPEHKSLNLSYLYKTLLKRCRLLLLSLLCFLPFLSSAQTVTVDSISIIGNKKTKGHVVLRELDFQVGDTLNLSNMMERFAENRFLLLNTGIFREAFFNIKDWDTETQKAHLELTVIEAWSIIPIPIFELADRNFNVWWKEMNRDLSRINYGLLLYHFNLTGRRDKLKLTGQWGYTRKGEIDYELPGINESQTIGLGLNVLVTRNSEIPFRASNNRLEFYKSPDTFLYNRFRSSVRAFYRPKLFSTHNLELFYHDNSVDDYVRDELNPDFFGNDKTRLSYFSLQYDFVCDKRDIKPYPTKGFLFSSMLRKDGLGVLKDRNAFHLTSRYARYIPLSKRFSIEAIAQGRYSFVRKQQPYYDMKALGFFEDYIRGYEFYVIDGLDYAYQKTALRFEIFKRDINFGRLSPFEALRIMPTRVYLNLNNDLGFTNDPYFNEDNPLNNSLLWGRGAGLDIIVYYLLVVQMEYSVNRQGEGGFFLHIRAGFN
ncbi:MAG: hypothetical protein ACI85O_001536 [Saprospiraceae bacterium]|jgi:hypothetical protein